MNRIFMLGFFVTYLFLSISGIEYFETKNITHADWSLCVFIIPFIISCFGWHNMIPSITAYLEKDRRKSITVILASAGLLFVIYCAWAVGLHGILPLEGEISIRDSFAKGEIVTEPLARLVQNPVVQFSSIYMAFFAIITSVLGQGLSVIDFLADALRVDKTIKTRVALCLLLFVPTLVCSQLVPGIFFKALELGGGIAAMMIFGVIPALMCWVNRYRRPDLVGQFHPLVPGGKIMLAAVVAVASSVIGYQIYKNIF